MAGAAAVFSLFMLWHEGKRVEELVKALRQKCQEFMTGFNDLAEDTGRNLLNNVRTLITQNINPIVAAFDEKIKAVESMTTNEKLKAKNSPRSSTRRKSLSARLSMNKAQVLNAPVFFLFYGCCSFKLEDISLKQGRTLLELGRELQRQRFNRQNFIADTLSLEVKSNSYGSTLHLSLEGKSFSFTVKKNAPSTNRRPS